MLPVRSRSRMRPSSWKMKRARWHHLPLTTRDIFGLRCRPGTTKFPSREKDPGSSVSAPSKSMLCRAKWQGSSGNAIRVFDRSHLINSSIRLLAGRGRPGSNDMHRRRTLETACPQAVSIYEVGSSRRAIATQVERVVRNALAKIQAVRPAFSRACGNSRVASRVPQVTIYQNYFTGVAAALGEASVLE